MRALTPLYLSTLIRANTLTNRSLIIVAHGSRRASSNEEVMALSEAVKVLKGNEFTNVSSAFLEFASPTLQESILVSIDKGMDEIVILPYFLASGNHVTRDIPQILQEIKTLHPQANIILKEHLGSAEGMVKLLAQMAK